MLLLLLVLLLLPLLLLLLVLLLLPSTTCFTQTVAANDDCYTYCGWILGVIDALSLILNALRLNISFLAGLKETTLAETLLLCEESRIEICCIIDVALESMFLLLLLIA